MKFAKRWASRTRLITADVDYGFSSAVPTGKTCNPEYGGMRTEQAQRLKELEKENSRLKRLLAERDLENDLLKELLSKKG